MTSSQPSLDGLLSRAVGSTVALQSKPPASPKLEEYWPDLENLAHRETITEEAMPSDTFFDGAVVHILTTATLERLQSIYPGGRFEARRFRPNLIVAPAAADQGFVENAWLGRTSRLAARCASKSPAPPAAAS